MGSFRVQAVTERRAEEILLGGSPIAKLNFLE
jgi:hypothetical protein